MGWAIFFRISFFAEWIFAGYNAYHGNTALTVLNCFTAWIMYQYAEYHEEKLRRPA